MQYDFSKLEAMMRESLPALQAKKGFSSRSSSFSSSESRALSRKVRYLQIAFNHDTATVHRVLPQIPRNERILIEAGTP